MLASIQEGTKEEGAVGVNCSARSRAEEAVVALEVDLNRQLMAVVGIGCREGDRQLCGG